MRSKILDENATIGVRALEFARRFPEKILLWDQDALNAILNQDWLAISPKWNVQTNFFRRQYLADAKFGKEETRAALRHPSIVHFTTANKPWHFRTTHPWQHAYYYYLDKTPWRDYVPADRTPLNMALKPVRILGRKLLQTGRYWYYSARNSGG